ncbi:MAG TPA: hypothetical protein VEZ24_13135 [Microvirga sp.]|nr:hypothetical protein [Microvirga sp.]
MEKRQFNWSREEALRKGSAPQQRMSLKKIEYYVITFNIQCEVAFLQNSRA